MLLLLHAIIPCFAACLLPCFYTIGTYNILHLFHCVFFITNPYFARGLPPACAQVEMASNK